MEPMNQDQLELVRQAVKETLISIGIDASDPIEAQKDMVTLRRMRSLMSSDDFVADQVHLRKWRLAIESVEKKSIVMAIAFILGGILALIWAGAKLKLGV